VCVDSRGSLGEVFCFVLLLIFRCVHSAVTPGESRFGLHCNGALVMGINAQLRDINSPGPTFLPAYCLFSWYGLLQT